MSKETDDTPPQQKQEPAEEAPQTENVSKEADRTSQKQESGEDTQTAAITKQAGQTLTYQKQKSESEDAQTGSVSHDADRPLHQKKESEEDAHTESLSEEADQTQPQQKQDSEEDAQIESVTQNNAGPSEVSNTIKKVVQQLPKRSFQVKLPPVILLPTDLIGFETILIKENTGRISMTPKSQIATTGKTSDFIPGDNTRDNDCTVIVNRPPNPSADSFEQVDVNKEIPSRRILMTPGKEIATADEVSNSTPREHTRAKDTIIVECPPNPSADRFEQGAVDRTKTFGSKLPTPVEIEQSPVNKEKVIAETETEPGLSIQHLNELPGRKRKAVTGSFEKSPRVQDETEMRLSKK